MTIRDLRVLHGPNIWAACPVLEFVLEGTEDQADALVATARTLQEIAGTPVAFAATRKTPRGIVLAAVEFAEEPVGRAALEIAVRLLATGAPPSADDVRRLKELPLAQRMSTTVATTYFGAQKLGIPVAMLSPEYGGYLVLGHGSKQRRVRWSEPDAVSGVARLASTDKYLTNQLLRSIGIPVPRGRLLSAVEEAWPAANEVGLPVAVKPYNCDLQTGVSLDLRTQDRVEAAFHAAIEHSSWVLVEHFAPGVEHRVVVVGDRVVAVTRIDPPRVIGDGVSTIAQLAEIANRDPRRGDDDTSDAPLSKLKLDEVAVAVLASQGYALDSVPAAGTVVLVRRDPPYFKNGGTLADLTDQIHPQTADYAVAAARMMGIPVAGLDVVALDISKTLAEQHGVIIEINANPGFWLHLAPWADSPRPVGEAVAAYLFPDGNDGRIPVFALVGDADGAVRRHLSALLTRAGFGVGTAGPSEMSSRGRSWPSAVETPRDRAYVLFRNPEVDVAVFETDGDELLDHGFATDRCDVAVLLSPPPSDDLDSNEFVRALTNALPPGGTFVATSGWTSARLGVSHERMILVAEPDAAARKAHLASGGQAVFIRENDVILADAAAPELVLGSMPETFSAAEVRHLLFVVAAAWSFGREEEKIAEYLRSLA